ncbi:MAG: STAS/SEC14 domain-containing protein [Bacteroidia bacterium]
MSSIEIKSALRVRLEEVLDGVSNLETPDLEKFLAEVAHLLVQRKVKTLPGREAELLLKINQRLLDEKSQDLYKNLYQKLHDESITAEEHNALMKLIQIREEKGVERMACLIELAQLRKISLKELMKQLGIHSFADAV